MAIFPGQKVGLIDVNLKSELSSLSSIVIKNNYLSSITVPTLSSLVEIDLSNNPFTLTGITFDSNPSLTGMTISGGGRNFNTEFLLNTPNLKYLNLSDNTITSVDINHLNDIAIIDLSINQLTEFNLYDKGNVEQLLLNNNILTSIDLSGLTGYYLTTLQTINLNDNQLTSVDFNGLNYVETLNIKNNMLSNLTLMGMNNLSYLDLGGNLLTGITLEYETSLIDLSLMSNLISDIDFTNYGNLISLNISDNLLTNIVLPPNIETLNISNNPTPLNQLIDVTGLTTVTTLTANYTDVTGMNMYESPMTSVNMAYTTGITTVIFPYNSLSLSLLHNNLVTFHIDYPSLEAINLTYCNLTAVTFGEISELNSIYLSNNNLATTELNQLFVDLDNATIMEYGYLDVRNNPGDINFSSEAFESLTITKSWNILNDGH